MANYLNRPSIFEIATAFEDGQQGEINKGKDGYKKTYGTLSNDEKSFVLHMRSTTMPIKQKELEENQEELKTAMAMLSDIVIGVR